MKRKLFLCMATALFTIGGLSAQTNQKEAAIRQIQSMSQEQISNYYKTVHSRTLDVKQIESLKKMAKSAAIPFETKAENTKGLTMPEKMWFPGEWEEVQAIYVTVPYYAFFKDDDEPAYPLFDQVGYMVDNQGQISKIDSIYYTMDTFSTLSRMPIIFAEMINGIQQHAQAWINLWDINDSTSLKNFMQRNGMPLTNYRFFEAAGNSFWYRDCGPVAFYYGDNDDIAFLDFEYYGGRPADDALPIKLGQATGYPVYTTGIEFEGGNILVDGAGTLFTSDALYGPNSDTYGQYYLSDPTDLTSLTYHTKPILSKAKVNDSLINLMGLDRLKVLPTLKYDGGTGHIDLYADMWDENHFVFSKYPTELSNLTDYAIAGKNIDTIASMYSFHNKNYYTDFIPFPKRDNNTWYTGNSNYERYTRTYSNHTMVNNAIIQPMFSNATWGAIAWEQAALDSIKAKYPGYEVIPVDVRGKSALDGDGFDGSGGAIHCITKQIPAENPIRILHAYKAGVNQTTFPITATITNRSGIASASCMWRTKGSTSWNTLPMPTAGNNVFSATITGNASATADTIEYYISATSNNGKTITKPITAPRGFYTIAYGSSIGINTIEGKETTTFGQFYPNPAKEATRIDIQNIRDHKMNVKVLSISGQVVYANNLNITEDVVFEMKTTSFKPGLYTVVFSNSKGEQIVRKLMIYK